MAGGDAAVRGRDAGWLRITALFLVLLALYAATGQRSAASLDTWAADYAAWHLAATGSPYLDDGAVPPLLDDSSKREVWLQDPAPNGHTVIARAPGVVLAGLPAYLLAAGDFSVLPAVLTAALLTALSALLMFLALRTRLTRREAELAAAAFALATPVWTVSADGLWPHTVTGLGIAGMAWAASTRRWWLVGLFGGFALWGRAHMAVAVALLGLAMGRSERSVAPVLKVALPSGAALVAMSGWCHWVYGTWNPLGAYGGGRAFSASGDSRLSLTNYLGMWVAPDRGVLVWTPVVLVLLPALLRAWPGLPAWSRGLLVGGLAYTVLQSAIITFTGGDFFYGYRLGLELVCCATPALAFSAHRAGRVARALVGPVLAVQLLAMAMGAVGAIHFLPEDRAWNGNAFLDLVWRTRPGGLVLVGVAVLVGAWLGRRWIAGPGLSGEAPRSHRTLEPATR